MFVADGFGMIVGNSDRIYWADYSLEYIVGRIIVVHHNSADHIERNTHRFAVVAVAVAVAVADPETAALRIDYNLLPDMTVQAEMIVRLVERMLRLVEMFELDLDHQDSSVVEFFLTVSHLRQQDHPPKSLERTC